MRLLAISCTLALALVGTNWLSGFSQPIPQTPPTGGFDGVQVHSAIVQNGNQQPIQQIVVVDTRQQTMAVYHIASQTGRIELKSVRKIQMDLTIEQFNASEPLPSDMRLLNNR